MSTSLLRSVGTSPGSDRRSPFAEYGSGRVRYRRRSWFEVLGSNPHPPRQPQESQPRTAPPAIRSTAWPGFKQRPAQKACVPSRATGVVHDGLGLTPCDGTDSGHGRNIGLVRSVLRASDGVAQSSTWRGRVLSSIATSRRCWAVCVVRSVPMGKYWRRSPLVFSLVGRCHGEGG